ncbi:TOBE domain-containing protein [Pseudonocardia oceani]|uniref:TOBE domain-containing protein n=1 Tax=Pseudonocardia oceani TaxID=2792013 RepID=UPI003FD772B0
MAGRIRQHGPTARVLDRPADADCAQLVGCTNLLPPALTGRSGLLVARPEHCRPLRLDDAPPPGDVRVPGTVRRIVPLGAGVRIDVDPESGGRPLACLVPAGGAVGLQRGSPTAVTVANADLRAVPPDA